MPNTAGETGFPDWQRGNPLDGAIVIDLNERLFHGQYESPPIAMGRYATLQANINVEDNNALVVVAWAADREFTKFLGELVFATATEVGGPVQLSLPIGGPWVKVLITPIENEEITLTITAQQSNRTGPTPFRYRFQPLIDQSPNVPAHSEVKVYPSSYYGGPVRFYYESANPEIVATLEILTHNNEWHPIAVLPHASVAADNVGGVIVPSDAWRVNLHNPGGTGTAATVRAIASLTGSS